MFTDGVPEDPLLVSTLLVIDTSLKEIENPLWGNGCWWIAHAAVDSSPSKHKGVTLVP